MAPVALMTVGGHPMCAGHVASALVMAVTRDPGPGIMALAETARSREGEWRHQPLSGTWGSRPPPHRADCRAPGLTAAGGPREACPCRAVGRRRCRPPAASRMQVPENAAATAGGAGAARVVFTQTWTPRCISQTQWESGTLRCRGSGALGGTEAGRGPEPRVVGQPERGDRTQASAHQPPLPPTCLLLRSTGHLLTLLGHPRNGREHLPSWAPGAYGGKGQ